MMAKFNAYLTIIVFGGLLLVIVAASTETSYTMAQAAPTATPTHDECPCWSPGDPDGQCVDCRDAEPDALDNVIYLPMWQQGE